MLAYSALRACSRMSTQPKCEIAKASHCSKSVQLLQTGEHLCTFSCRMNHRAMNIRFPYADAEYLALIVQQAVHAAVHDGIEAFVAPTVQILKQLGRVSRSWT